MSCIILKKTRSVISKLFLLNCISHYISNWLKVLEFYLASFFNMKSWRGKFRNFLGDFPVHYAALFINRTINNNYMTLLMALHHTHDGLFRCFKSNTHSWCTSNFESANKKPYFIRVAAFSHTIISMEVKSPSRRTESPFLAARLKKIQIPQDAHLAAFHIKHMWLLLLLCRI